jgi:peptidoglycan/LPS O-acetylase OafA/YrhL
MVNGLQWSLSLERFISLIFPQLLSLGHRHVGELPLLNPMNLVVSLLEQLSPHLALLPTQ